MHETKSTPLNRHQILLRLFLKKKTKNQQVFAAFITQKIISNDFQLNKEMHETKSTPLNRHRKSATERQLSRRYMGKSQLSQKQKNVMENSSSPVLFTKKAYHSYFALQTTQMRQLSRRSISRTHLSGTKRLKKIGVGTNYSMSFNYNLNGLNQKKNYGEKTFHALESEPRKIN